MHVPEIIVYDRYSGELVEGVCEIPLSEEFIASTVIDEEHPIHVIATPTSEGSLWVEKFNDRVVVRGTCSSFDLSITARKICPERDLKYDEFVKDEDTGHVYPKSVENVFLLQKPLMMELKEKEIEVMELIDELKNPEPQIQTMGMGIQSVENTEESLEIEKVEKRALLNEKRREIANIEKEIYNMYSLQHKDNEA